MADRLYRISCEIKKEVSKIIQNELKDPRLSTMISVISVDVTNDLRYAKIYVSVLGNEKEKSDSMAGLKSAEGYVRREIGHRVNMRYTPEVIFKLDDSIEYGINMAKLIKDTMRLK